jgi:hypothetical protein
MVDPVQVMSYIEERRAQLSFAGDYSNHPHAVSLKKIETDCINRFISAELGLTQLEYAPVQKHGKVWYEFWWYDPSRRSFVRSTGVPAYSGEKVSPNEF